MAEDKGAGTTGSEGGRRRSLFDDLAGVAGGAFSAIAGMRAEIESMAHAQVEAMVQRLELVRREDLDAAMEVARRAREGEEVLATRVAALEARLTALEEQLGAGPGKPEDA
jgi:BMFP domain-containing protein YqiC